MIDIGIVPEMFHDVDFTTIRPVQRFVGLRHHPNGRPETLRHIKFGPYINATEAERFPIQAPHASSKKRGLVIRQKVIHHATQHEIAILKSIQRIMRRHVDSPISLAAPYFRPDLFIQDSRIEFIVPNQGVTTMFLSIGSPNQTNDNQQNKV